MIYLIASESNQLLKEKLDDIISDFENVTYINYVNSTMDEILAEASYYSMFDEKKALIVKNANCFANDKISEENSNKLLNYLANPNDLTTLIFTTNAKIDMRKKITKQIKDKYNLINILPLKPREIVMKIKEIFLSNGYSVGEDSINYIIKNNANNYDLIYSEINKIMLFYIKPCKILYDDVVNIVAKSLDANNFKFVDMIVAKDIKEAFKIYQDLKLTKVEPLSLIGLLAREFRLMYFAKILKEEHYSIYDICTELALQDWQLEKFLVNGKKYKIDELATKLKELAILDLNIKSGKIDKWVGIAKIIVDFSE